MWQPSLGTITLQGCGAWRLPGLVCSSDQDMVGQELTRSSVGPPQARSSHQTAAVRCLAMSRLSSTESQDRAKNHQGNKQVTFRDKPAQGELGGVVHKEPLTLSPESPPFFRFLTFCLISPGACGPRFPYCRHRQSTSHQAEERLRGILQR